MAMTRVQQLNGAVDRLRMEHDLWQKDPEQGTNPSHGMVEAIRDMMEAFHAGPCPMSHLKLNNAAMAFSLKVEEWEEEANGDPRPGYWNALRELFAARERLNVKPPGSLPTCKALRHDRKMTDSQICMDYYGFRTSDGKTFDPESERYAGPLLNAYGQIDNELLEKEIEQPWSVIPKDWINPRARKELEEAGYFDKSPACGKVPATPEENKDRAIKMLTGGGTVTQIADVCKMTTAEVEALADAEGLPLPDFSAADEPVDAEKERLAIVEASSSGLKPDQIVNKLRAAGMKRVNLGRVKAVLNASSAVATK